MSKDQKFLIIIIGFIVILAGAFGVYAYKHKDSNVCKSEETDAIRFKREYEEYNGKTYDNTDIEYFTVTLSNKNIFKYATSKKVIDIIKNDTGIIYFGFPQCPWCRSLIPYLESAAKSNGINKIYYLNILDLRDSYKIEDNKLIVDKEGTDEYYKILDLLKDYLKDYYITDDSGKKYDTGVKRLYAPTVVIVKNGKIVDFHEGTVDTQEKYVPLTKDEEKLLKETLNKKISKISNTVCTNNTAC